MKKINEGTSLSGYNTWSSWGCGEEEKQVTIHLSIYDSFLCSFNKGLLRFYNVPSSVVSAGYAVRNSTDTPMDLSLKNNYQSNKSIS